MNAPWFRTSGPWGAANSGGNLSGPQFDENTYFFLQAITALQSAPSAAAGIAFFTITGDQLTVTMTDHTTRGPYTIPISAFRFRGAWQPFVTYFVNDVITANGACYIVTFDHTSAATFNAGANDGLGHDFYGLMLASPGNSLPTGGAVGQFVVKTTTTDFAVSWAWPLPTGGTTGQVLLKLSNANQDANWSTAPWITSPPLSPIGIPGQILSTVDGTRTNTAWIDQVTISGVISAPPVSPPGLPGQLLITVDGTPANMEWKFIADTIQFVIDGGGSTITTGTKGYIEVPYGCTIDKASMFADQTGSIVIDVWKCAYSAFDAGSTHPVVGDSITSVTPPTIASSTKYQDSTLAGWTTSVTVNDILAFHVTSVSTIQRVTIALDITR